MPGGGRKPRLPAGISLGLPGTPRASLESVSEAGPVAAFISPVTGKQPPGYGPPPRFLLLEQTLLIDHGSLRGPTASTRRSRRAAPADQNWPANRELGAST